MGRMKRWRFTLAALAGLLLLSGLGSASASAPIGTAEKGPLTTGRALIDVRTPELPPLRGLGAIRPPTVPPGTSRLRLTTMATHRIADLRRRAELIDNAARDLGLSAPPARDLPLAA